MSKSTEWVDVDSDEFPSEIEVEYEYTPFRAATYQEPSEGGVEITKVWLTKSQKVGPDIKIDIYDVVSDNPIKKWEDTIWDRIQNHEPEYEKDLEDDR